MNSVLSFLSLLGKGLFSVIKWLLFKLGLWVPAVFSVLFWLVVLVTGTEFSDVVGVYIFGLCATVLFAVAITFLDLFSGDWTGKPRKNALRRLCRKLNRRKKEYRLSKALRGKRRKPHPSDKPILRRADRKKSLYSLAAYGLRKVRKQRCGKILQWNRHTIATNRALIKEAFLTEQKRRLRTFGEA